MYGWFCYGRFCYRYHLFAACWVYFAAGHAGYATILRACGFLRSIHCCLRNCTLSATYLPSAGLPYKLVRLTRLLRCGDGCLR